MALLLLLINEFNQFYVMYVQFISPQTSDISINVSEIFKTSILL